MILGRLCLLSSSVSNTCNGMKQKLKLKKLVQLVILVILTFHVNFGLLKSMIDYVTYLMVSLLCVLLSKKTFTDVS